MIYVEKPNAKEKDFIFLLEKSKGLTIGFLKGKKISHQHILKRLFTKK